MCVKNLWKNHRYSFIAFGLSFALIVAVIVLLLTMGTENTVSDTAITDFTNIKHDRGEFGENIIVHDSADGEITIHSPRLKIENQSEPDFAVNPLKTISDPEKIWESSFTYSGDFTLTEDVRLQNGSLGVLSIPAIKMSANVYESTDTMEDMRKGIAHFPSTSAFLGNIGLSAHNINLDGSDGFFKNLYLLNTGDTITYKTALGTKTYSISSVSTISENDWTPLSYTDDNRLTLITCISDQRDKRLCVQALEIQQ